MIISISGTIPKKLQLQKMRCQMYFHGKNVRNYKNRRLVKRQANYETSLVLGSDIDVEYEVDIVENEAPFELVDSTNSDKPVDAFTQTESKSAFLSARKFADNNKAFLF